MTQMVFDADSMVPCKTYLIRAVHDWCSVHGLTPYLRVFVDAQVMVPPGYASNQELVLNVSFDATNNLVLGDFEISFQARFVGVPRDVLIPVDNVLAIFAKENMQGLTFTMPSLATSTQLAMPQLLEQDAAQVEQEETEPPPRPKPGKPNLTIIK